ncbi:hypothetical protein CDO73_04000 [Saccharibacillus sp. O23]|uniref:hypothetical protein n=1 Tax=Saccharibacillus sp. O23 TaxID=2009338 RepID=UPI000B4E2011|nr:hypothetical protein [Saccharibacillus sp. O23]OWR32769.1 hypothetical protein CDO73_04000 [Saccharibacillus sp. O23]
MKRILFVGDKDKTDLLFYLAKTLSESGKKTLIVDATLRSDYEYACPVVDVSGEPREYDGFEIWTPFRSLGHDAGEALAAKAEDEDYDVVLYDTDHAGRLAMLPETDLRFLLLGCEQTSLQRSLRLLEAFFAGRPVAEWYAFHRIMIEGADEPGDAYIDGQFEPFPIEWKKRMVYYPDERNLSVKIANQYAERLRMKGISPDLKKVVQELAAVVLGIDEREARKLWKRAERSK